MEVTNIKLAIGFPLSFNMIPAPFLETIMTIERPDFLFIQAYNGPIDEMRNDLVLRALNNKCTHLIMMDTDMTYHPKTLSRLLSHNLDVVGALCYRRYPPFDPLMLKGTINHYETIKEWEPDSLVEVDATGTGCLMFNTDVFRKMPLPWFKFRKNPDEEKGGSIGEDIGFCYDLREAGYRIFVDTSIPSGHLTTMIVNHGTWKLYEKMREVHGINVKSREGGDARIVDGEEYVG
jgi:hypothetical protein